MITAEDMKFHQPSSDDPLWTETNYFPFTIPEAAIQGAFYVMTRKNVGVCHSDVFAFQGHSKTPMDALYYDKHAQLPCPERLEDYTLLSGLSVKSVNAPMEYELHYKGYDDTEFHIHYKGVAAAYDIADPEMDPITAQQVQENKTKQSWAATAWAGHFDHTLHATGECRILGTPYKIDCVTTMDHSWGLRPEMDSKPIVWIHGHWGKDLVIHCIFHFDPMNTDKIGPLLHGYVIEDGKIYGLMAGEGTAKRDGFMAQEVELSVTDVRGKTYSMRGDTVATYPWFAWPGLAVHTALIKWDEKNGQTGWGETQDCLNMKEIIRANKLRKSKQAA